jgi:hypothetical protein
MSNLLTHILAFMTQSDVATRFVLNLILKLITQLLMPYNTIVFSTCMSELSSNMISQ